MELIFKNLRNQSIPIRYKERNGKNIFFRFQIDIYVQLSHAV